MKFSTQIIQIRPDLAQQFIAVLGTQNRVDIGDKTCSNES